MLTMTFYSTKNPSFRVDFRRAVLEGLPPDNGLYMPVEIPELDPAFWQSLQAYRFPELAFRMAENLLRASLPARELEAIVHRAINFPAPLRRLGDGVSVLELFHGPSMAFKDFGARFMAEVMSYLNRGEDRELTVLVATSGDTGGAVAAGFHSVPGIRVVILYPSGKVSPLQEKQLTTWGGNVQALEVSGTFDDCQAMVKRAFLDEELRRRMRLTSANSINIARLIPQSFYYAEGYKQVLATGSPPAFVVPSGNFGNLTAGLFARRMGMPAQAFVAATNLNDVVPAYLKSGRYEPRPSVRTLSNAMDVGAPSNFARLMDLYGSTWNNIRQDLAGFSFSDAQSLDAMRGVHERFSYVLDPHTAVGYLAARAFLRPNPDRQAIVLGTAHPAKFNEVVEQALGSPVPLPPALEQVLHQAKDAQRLAAQFDALKSWMLD